MRTATARQKKMPARRVRYYCYKVLLLQHLNKMSTITALSAVTFSNAPLCYTAFTFCAVINTGMRNESSDFLPLVKSRFMHALAFFAHT